MAFILSDENKAELRKLEDRLWHAETRFDRGLMARTFAEDFFQFGRSGRRQGREELLFDKYDSREIFATLHQFAARALSARIAQCIYISQVVYPAGTEWANRSSIWDRSSGQWRLRFHQATPTTALPGRR